MTKAQSTFWALMVVIIVIVAPFSIAAWLWIYFNNWDPGATRLPTKILLLSAGLGFPALGAFTGGVVARLFGHAYAGAKIGSLVGILLLLCWPMLIFIK